VAATREAVRERERADDQQLVHAVRAMDDCERTANELAERAAEWAGSLFDDAEPGIEGARAVADREPTGELERRAVSLAARVVDLAAERATRSPRRSTGSRRRWRRTSPRWPGPSSRRG